MRLRSVLVADDSRVFRAVMSAVLREHNLEVFEAANGKEALDLVLANRPDLVILDALMPLLSGFDVLAQLRQKAPDYKPVLFVVTGVYKSRRWETEARQAYEIQEYMEKPLEPEDLLAAVARHFPDFSPRST
ncbi:MAG: response regulator [Thermoanaerobaculales bacterium]